MNGAREEDSVFITRYDRLLGRVQPLPLCLGNWPAQPLSTALAG